MFDPLFTLAFLGIVITRENYIIGPAGCKAGGGPEGRTGGTVPLVHSKWKNAKYAFFHCRSWIFRFGYDILLAKSVQICNFPFWRTNLHGN